MSQTPRWNMASVDFVEVDAEKIKAGIVSRCEAAIGRTLATGDPLRLFLLAEAAEIIRLHNLINMVGQQNLLTYAQGKFLDAKGEDRGVSRLPEAAAQTTLRFQLEEPLANAYTIPQGFEVSNGIVSFATDNEVIIPAGSMVAETVASCTTPGTVGNDYLPGQISTIVTPLAFLVKAENITTTAGGADVENDEEYAERVRIAMNRFSVAGPTKAYIFHAYSVSSAIISVKVDSPTPGVVNVYTLVENGELPSDELLADIEAYLSSDSIRPLTDEVHALRPDAKEFTINVDYWIYNDDKVKAEGIKAAVEKAVEEYRLWQQLEIGRDITPDKLIQSVLGAGAARVDFTTLSPASFEELQPFEVAQCTGVTINYKGYKEV